MTGSHYMRNNSQYTRNNATSAQVNWDRKHERSRSAQPVADIVQRGLGDGNALRINDLTRRQQRILVNN